MRLTPIIFVLFHYPRECVTPDNTRDKTFTPFGFVTVDVNRRGLHLQRVFTALNWLRANNPFYSDIRINADNINSLPDNGSLQDLYETCGDDDLDSKRDTGPQQDSASEGDEDTEFFLRSVVGNGMQKGAIIDLLLQNCFGLSAATLLQALAPVPRQQPLPSLGQKWRTRPSTRSRRRGYVPCVSLLYSRTVVKT